MRGYLSKIIRLDLFDKGELKLNLSCYFYNSGCSAAR